MSLPPQSNGTLTAVQSIGFSEDYNRDETDSPPKWAGESPVYVSNKLRTLMDGQGALNRVQDIRVYMDPELVMNPPLALGDVLVFNYQGKTFTAKVQDVVLATLAGVPNYMMATLEEMNAQ